MATSKSCPACGRKVPEDARFCPYCGYKLCLEDEEFVVIEDVKELESIVKELQNYLPAEWSCKVDKKRRRLKFEISLTGSFLAFSIPQRVRGFLSLEMLARLEEALKVFEHEVGVKLVKDEITPSWTIVGFPPTLYYKVYRISKRSKEN